mgnify:FL=1
MSPDSVRKLASDVMESCGGRCAVFNGNDETAIVISSEKKTEIFVNL